MILLSFFDISSGFRFTENQCECSVHILRRPCLGQRSRPICTSPDAESVRNDLPGLLVLKTSSKSGISET